MDPLDYENSNEQTEGKLASYSDLFAALSFVMLFLYIISALRSNVQEIANIEKRKEIIALHDKEQDYIREEHKKHLLELEQKLNDLMKMYSSEMKQPVIALELQKQLAKEIEINSNSEADLLAELAIIQEKKKKLVDYKKTVTQLNDANSLLKGRLNNERKKFSDASNQAKALKKETARLNRKIVKTKKKLVNRYENKLKNQKSYFNNKLKIQKTNLVGLIRNQKKKYKTQIKDQKNMFSMKIATQEKQFVSKIKNKELQFSTILAETRSLHDYELKEKEVILKQELTAQEKMIKELEQQKYNQEISKIKNKYSQYSKKLVSDVNKKYENKLNKQVAEFTKEKQGLGRKIASLETNLNQTKSEAEQVKKSLNVYKQKKESMKHFAKDLHTALSKVGLATEIDVNKNEIKIPFGQVYFGYGSEKLKGKMKNVIDKVFPVFAQVVMTNGHAEKIKNIEIIGYASPTFNGRYFNPSAVDAFSRRAIKYNMELSYLRASSIFNYAFQDKALNYPHQKDLLRMMKLSGRGHFGGTHARIPASKKMSSKVYCRKYNCKKQQKAVLKLHFK